MSVRISTRIVWAIFLAAAASADLLPARADEPDNPAYPQLPPSQWELKQDAPAAVGRLLDRAKRQRELEFATQLRAVELARKDVEARKAGRVVRELNAPEGWRAVPARSRDGFEY